ncbi:MULTISPECIES: hypothetical protein [unclassified Achromobacter]|uniref:hypothetical protein n=1 Tax=unclassified Achromobacter TaxID=2626865 RepID=UPI001177AF77|nr:MULTISPECIES: hypothetical protein [unclassified Achromobacter]
MRLIELRQVRRTDAAGTQTLVLQARHRYVSRIEHHLMMTHTAASPLGWGHWEDVPIVDDERHNMQHDRNDQEGLDDE